MVGARGIEAAAAAWKVPIRWFEESGHYPHVEEPEAFAAAVVGFLKGEDPASR